MMRVLIMCNTYYLLIESMQLRLTMFKDVEVDVLMFDTSGNCRDVCENLRRAGTFNDVLFMERGKSSLPKNIFGKVRNVAYAVSPLRKPFTQKRYDQVLFHTYFLELCALIDYYESIGHKFELTRIEEGLLSYETDSNWNWSRSSRIANAKRKLLKGDSYKALISSYYCFFPAMKLTTAPGVELRAIPPISQTQQQLVPLLKAVFDVDGFSCPQHYIYFASSSDVDGTPFGETELVLKIAQLVGPQNLLVKMHPRDTRTVYRDAGIAVMENSYVPWEVMQLIGDVAGKTLITSVSGSFISVSAMMQPAPRSLFVFAPVEGNEWYRARTAYIADVVERLHAQGLCPNIQAIPLDSLEEELGRELEPASAPSAPATPHPETLALQDSTKA